VCAARYRSPLAARPTTTPPGWPGVDADLDATALDYRAPREPEGTITTEPTMPDRTVAEEALRRPPRILLLPFAVTAWLSLFLPVVRRYYRSP
jgi:hypothetical protein